MWGMLKSHQLGVAMQVTKGALFMGKAGSYYVILLYCETLLQVLLGIYCKRFYWIPLVIHYTTVILRVWGWQSQKCNSNNANTAVSKFYAFNCLKISIFDKSSIHIFYIDSYLFKMTKFMWVNFNCPCV